MADTAPPPKADAAAAAAAEAEEDELDDAGVEDAALEGAEASFEEQLESPYFEDADWVRALPAAARFCGGGAVSREWRQDALKDCVSSQAASQK